MKKDAIDIQKYLTFFKTVVDSDPKIYICNNAGWIDLRLYAWGEENDAFGVWPGAACEDMIVKGRKKYYAFDVSTSKSKNQNYIVNNNDGGMQIDVLSGVLNQSVYLTINKDLSVSIDKSKGDSIIEDINKIDNKSKDPKLYLAVVGEFNAGKSTFINALLRKRILKEAVRPTTACATYIEKGKGELKLEVSFNKKRFAANENNYSELKTFLKAFYSGKIKNFNHIIEILTSEQEVSKMVTDLHLYIPDSNLPDDVVIIDTPGFNPGDDAVSNHFGITRDVVANVADVALVLMPSGQPFSDTIREFTSSHLQPYLHRCLFVVTKADEKNKEDRQEIRKFTLQRCKEDLRLNEARVFFESAITMLPVVKIPDSLKAEWTFWQKEFKAFEKYVWDLLSRQKETILSEHLHNLALLLCKNLNNELLKKEEKLKERETELNKSRVSKIQTVTDKLVADAKASIANKASAVKTSSEQIIFSQQKDSVIRSAKTKITLDNLNDRFTENVIPEIESLVRNANSDIQRDVNSLMKNLLQKEVDANIKGMKSKFNEHYSMFPALTFDKKSVKIGVDDIDMPNIDFDIAKKMKESAENKGDGAHQGGAWIGLAAGGLLALLTGGFAIPFLAGGGFLGSFFGANKKQEILKEALPKIQSAIENEINAFFDKLSDSYVREIENQQTKINNAIKSFGDQHVQTYGAKVQSLIDKWEMQKKHLEQRVKTISEQIRSLEEIEEEIKCNIALLKTK